MAAACIRGGAVFSPKEAEAMAVREALSWLKNRDISQVQVETDSLQIIQSLKLNVEDSSFDLVISDVKDLLCSLSHVTIFHARRIANSVAHRLVREAYSLSVGKEWSFCPPSFIVNVLYSNLH